MKEEIFEGDINRIKAWIHFKGGSDVDEDTQLLINDVKLLFDTIAERDEELVKLRQHLSLAVEGLRFYADSDTWIGFTMNSSLERVRNDVYEDKDRYLIGGKTARETLKQIGETE